MRTNNVKTPENLMAKLNQSKDADLSALDSFHRKICLVRDRVTAVAEGLSTGMYLFGAGGIGKTHAVTKRLEELGVDYRLFNSRMTAKGLFTVLSGAADAIHVLDDMERLTNDKDAQGVLRSALGSIEGRERVVTWTTADEPRKSPFRGGIIMIANRPLACLPELKAMATRIAVHQLDVTDAEQEAVVRDLASRGYRMRDKQALGVETCLEVVEFMLAECRSATCPLDLRMLTNCYHDYIQWESRLSDCHWRDLVRARVQQAASHFAEAIEKGTKEERKAACRRTLRSIMAQTNNVQEQMQRYIAETGRSRTDFYRIKGEIDRGEFGAE